MRKTEGLSYEAKPASSIFKVNLSLTRESILYYYVAFAFTAAIRLRYTLCLILMEAIIPLLRTNFEANFQLFPSHHSYSYGLSQESQNFIPEISSRLTRKITS